MTRRHLVAVALVGALVGLWISPGRAYAVELEHAAHTAAATSPGLPACRVEDGSGQRACVWDARHAGNGAGRSVVIRHGGTDRATVRVVTHRRAHRLIRRWEVSH